MLSCSCFMQIFFCPPPFPFTANIIFRKTWVQTWKKPRNSGNTRQNLIWLNPRCRFCGAIWRFSAPKIAKNRPKSGPKIAKLMQIGAENRQKSPKIMPKWCKSSPTFGKGVNCAWHCSKETILDYVHIIFFFFYWNHLLVPKIVILARFSAPKIVKQYSFSAPNEANSATA